MVPPPPFLFMNISNLFHYNNYRDFLRDFYQSKKGANPDYSYRAFNIRAQISSPSFYKAVADGQRDLTEKTIAKFAKGLGLNKRETQFFRALVHFNQSQNEKEKIHHFNQISHFKEYNQIREVTPDLYDFFFHWHNVAIYELSKLKEFRENAKWIAEKLDFKISAEDAETSLQLLKTLGLLVKDKKTLKYKAVDKNLATTPEVTSLAVSKYQKNMMQKALENLAEAHHKHRDISGITVATDAAGFAEAQKRIREFRKELNVLLSATPTPDRIYQINFQIFPLSKIKG